MHALVFVAAGFLVLHRRMKETFEPQLRILRHVWLRFIFVILFLGLNMLVVVYGPKQRLNDGQFSIDRVWWPCIFFLVLSASFIYWLALTVPQLKGKKSGRTIGERLGFKVTVYRDVDPQESWPTYMWGPMMQARQDGTGRRVEYKVSRLWPIINALVLSGLSCPENLLGSPIFFQK